MLPIISFLLEDTLQISINWPSHMLDCSYKVSIFISSHRLGILRDHHVHCMFYRQRLNCIPQF